MKPNLKTSIVNAAGENKPVNAISLGTALSQAAIKWPDQEAVVYTCQSGVPEIRWTYKQLNNLAERLATSLLAQGFIPGERIAIWGPNHPEWILLEYALAKAGIILVALNPLYKTEELAYALNASEVSGIFHADTVGETALLETINLVRDSVPSLRKVFSFSAGITSLLDEFPESRALDPVNPEDILMIQYTSGTTGKPKAAQLTHAAITTTARASYSLWNFQQGSRVCHGFPLFHVGGSGNSIPAAALHGATTLPLYIFKAEQTLNILEQERCQGFIGVPTMITAMLDHPSFAGRDFSALEYIVLGGAQVPSALIKRCELSFGVQVINCYGQTETCGVTTSTVISDSTETKSSSSGKPLAGISVKIVDKQGEIVPLNQPGELCYQGPGQMLGYREQAVNQMAFDKDGWFKSGDLARMDSQGNVTVVGRSREMIIRGGENLSPSEIEAFLLEHPEISEVSVVGIPDQKYGEEVCAAIRPKTASTPTPEAIQDWCKARISRWKVPKYIVFVKDFPTTHSGKIKKFQLREQMIAQLGISQA